METFHGNNFQNQPKQKVFSPHQHQHSGILKPPLSLASRDTNGSPHEHHVPVSEHAHDSSTESAGSHKNWPTSEAFIANKIEKDKEGEADCPDISVTHRVSGAAKVSLREVARESVDVISERMHHLPDELLEEIKLELRTILDGTGGAQHREEFLTLQNLIQNRGDLTSKTLISAHRAQLEILVAIKTGIQAFLHPSICLSQTSLMEVFAYKKCRNIACQSQIPAEDCTCIICTNRNGFCNLCMCVICNKFDFEVNTCRWIGCDLCSHWTHTDCAIREGHIGVGPCVRSGSAPPEMLFRCRACNRTSELLGWVKDVFQHCAIGWDRDSLMRELEYACKIFRGSEDPRGRKLFRKCDDLLEKIKGGMAESTVCRVILFAFQELDADDPSKKKKKAPIETDEAGTRMVAPEEACNQIAQVVEEAIRKMEMVAEEKMRMSQKAHIALDACEREVEDKTREVSALKQERQRKKQQIEELEKIVRLKQAEAEMFEVKAREARNESERLQRAALAECEKSEEEYASRYLKLRLEEAEAEKQFLFEKMKMQECGSSNGSRQGINDASGSTQKVMYGKIQDFLNSVYTKQQSLKGDFR